MIRIESLDHIEILAPPDGEEAARAFYGDLLGLTEIEKPPELKTRGGVWFKIGQGPTLLHIGVEEAPSEAGSRHFALRVADVPGTRQELAAAGVRTGEAPTVQGLPRFYAWDPFGNQIEFLNYASAKHYHRFRAPVRQNLERRNQKSDVAEEEESDF